MKIAVFSDAHGNLKALKAILEQIKERNVDLTVFLGDIFQRGNVSHRSSRTYSVMLIASKWTIFVTR